MSIPFKKIRVTLDGSELAKAALPYAQLLAAINAQLAPAGTIRGVVTDRKDVGLPQRKATA